MDNSLVSFFIFTKLLYVKGCQVQKVLFPMDKSGQWLNNAYVILSSADDVDTAITKHTLSTNAIRGNI